MSKKKTNIYLQRLNSFSKEVDYKYNCISLFSGGGGLDLGAHFAGFKTLLVSDIIAAYTETIKANLPHVSVYNDDAMDLTAEKIRGLAKALSSHGYPPGQNPPDSDLPAAWQIPSCEHA